jgi:mRNA interferase MazF
MAHTISRFDVFMVSLSSESSGKIRAPEPCIIISPDELNNHLNTVIVAPVRDHGRTAPFRVSITIDGKKYQLALDQIRSIDKTRLSKKIGRLNQVKSEAICNVLAEMFAGD